MSHESKRTVLDSKAAKSMRIASPKFDEKCKEYEPLHNKIEELYPESQEAKGLKKQKLDLKTKIDTEITRYKQNPQNWVASNAPSAVKEHRIKRELATA